jgi:hypothetical protein
MPISVPVSILTAFRNGIWRTTRQKWIDITIFVVPILALILLKPASVWEALAPFIWAVAYILAVHWITAVRDTRSRVGMRRTHETKSSVLLADGTHSIITIVEEPPSWFRLKLFVTACTGILVLGALSYWVRILEVDSLQTYVFLVPTMELVECQQRAFFVKSYGPIHVSGLKIALKDEKSGQTFFPKVSDLDADTRVRIFLGYSIVAVE